MQLTPPQQQFWQQHSYLVMQGLFAAEAQALSAWIDEVGAWPVDICRWLSFFEMDDATKLSRVENFVPYHPGLADIINGSAVLEIASALMGEPALLYKDRINFKPPGGGAHAAHQDGVAYEMGGQSSFLSDSVPYISALIGVDAATPENGCFQVAREWPLDNLEILPMERPYPQHPNFSKIAQHVEDAIDWLPIETGPGDVIFFTERLPHRSTANFSQKRRRILYGVYSPATEGDKREQYYADKRRNINDARYMVGNPHAPTPPQ